MQVDYPSTGDGTNPVEVPCNLINTGTTELQAKINVVDGRSRFTNVQPLNLELMHKSDEHGQTTCNRKSRGYLSFCQAIVTFQTRISVLPIHVRTVAPARIWYVPFRK